MAIFAKFSHPLWGSSCYFVTAVGLEKPERCP